VREKVAGCWKRLHNEELHNVWSTKYFILIVQVKENEMSGACSTNGRYEIYVQFWLENLKGRNHSEDHVIDGRIILEWMLRKEDEKMWTGCMWLRVGNNGGLL
jgi:hypothetical protein